SLPSRTPKTRAPAPKQMRAVSAVRVALFHHGGLLLPQPFGQFAGPVRHDDVGACALERCHDLKNGGTLIQQAFLGSAPDHCVLATNVIDGGRFSKALTYAPQDVEIRQ